MIICKKGSVFVGLLIIFFFVTLISALMIKTIAYQYDILHRKHVQQKVIFLSESLVNASMQTIISEKDITQIKQSPREFIVDLNVDNDVQCHCTVSIAYTDNNKIKSSITTKIDTDIVYQAFFVFVFDDTYKKTLIAWNVI